MERRDLLALGGLAALAALTTKSSYAAQTTEPGAWQTTKPSKPITIRRIYANEQGDSVFEMMTLADKLEPIPLTNLRAVNYAPAKNNWHNAPYKTFAINMVGDLEVETSTHTKHKVGPGDLVFMMDLTGKGHVTRILGPVQACFIAVDPKFDIVSWAKGGPAIPA